MKRSARPTSLASRSGRNGRPGSARTPSAFSPQHAAKGDEAEARKRCADAIRNAARSPIRLVTLCLENHGGVTSTADGLLDIVKRVRSKAFGVQHR